MFEFNACLALLRNSFAAKRKQTDVRGLQVVWIRVYMFHSITRITHNCPIDILRGRRLLDKAVLELTVPLAKK
jgi:hypothetical protein